VRDRRCYHRFCDLPAEACQVDHIIPWSHDGPATQANGRLACDYHNRNRAPDDDNCSTSGRPYFDSDATRVQWARSVSATRRRCAKAVMILRATGSVSSSVGNSVPDIAYTRMGVMITPGFTTKKAPLAYMGRHGSA